jgi:hypothetical protein
MEEAYAFKEVQCLVEEKCCLIWKLWSTKLCRKMEPTRGADMVVDEICICYCRDPTIFLARHELSLNKIFLISRHSLSRLLKLICDTRAASRPFLLFISLLNLQFLLASCSKTKCWTVDVSEQITVIHKF